MPKLNPKAKSASLNLSELIKSSEHFVVQTIPVLNRKGGGWWKLILMGGAGGVITFFLILANKIDPHRPLESIRRSPPQQHSGPVCRIIEDGIICDRAAEAQPHRQERVNDVRATARNNAAAAQTGPLQ